MDVKRGNMVLKSIVRTKPADVGGCIPALAGLDRLFPVFGGVSCGLASWLRGAWRAEAWSAAAR
jgi:hypothetical protein